MYQINILDYRFNSILLIFLCYLSIAFEVDTLNNLYFILIAIFAFVQNYFKYKYKNFYSGLIAIGSFYVQFLLSDNTLTKEYFLNLIFVLILLKFSELKNKNNYYFFTYTCIFLAIGSLLYGQDIISSSISIIITILAIILLYSINQTKIVKINLKNLLKYLILSISVFPIILIIYLIFPRTEINIKLFESKQNNLGIPDKISLGSFENISNNDDDVFIYVPQEKIYQEKLYFRVKTFSFLDRDINWISINQDALLKTFSKNFKIKKDNIKELPDGMLILYPHNKNWVPKLSNLNFKDSNISYNFFDDLSYSSKKITKKIPLNLYKQSVQLDYEKDFINFYKKLPENNFQNLSAWAKENYKKSLNDKDYLDKILTKFSSGSYYYNLSPKNINNDYEKFFFETKTGYCEYYAGTFVILARLVGIPARIVSGYYGGELNSLGKFYKFKQQDAHSWVEVYLDNKWIRFDPTIVIPPKNIINSNNLNLNNTNASVQNIISNNSQNLNNVNLIRLYFDYANYLWTNSFIKYDENKRKKFIQEKIFNFDFTNKLSLYLLFFSFLFVFIFLLKIIVNKKIFFNLFFKKIRKLYDIKEKNLTHQEIYDRLSFENQKLWKDIFVKFEKITFSIEKNITFKEFLKFNYEILKIKKPPKI